MRRAVIALVATLAIGAAAHAQDMQPIAGLDQSYFLEQLREAGVDVGSVDAYGRVFPPGSATPLSDAASVTSIQACLATNVLGGAKARAKWTIRAQAGSAKEAGFAWVIGGSPVVVKTDAATQTEIMGVVGLGAAVSYPVACPSTWLVSGSATLNGVGDIQTLVSALAAWRFGLSQRADALCAQVDAATTVAGVSAVPLK